MYQPCASHCRSSTPQSQSFHLHPTWRPVHIHQMEPFHTNLWQASLWMNGMVGAGWESLLSRSPPVTIPGWPTWTICHCCGSSHWPVEISGICCCSCCWKLGTMGGVLILTMIYPEGLWAWVGSSERSPGPTGSSGVVWDLIYNRCMNFTLNKCMPHFWK